MKIIDFFKRVIMEPEENENPETGEMGEEWKPVKRNKDVRTDAVIMVCKPLEFEDSRHLCDLLKEGKAVLICMKDLRTDHRQRFLDFLSGVIIAIEGSIRKLDQDTVICTPENIEMIEDTGN